MSRVLVTILYEDQRGPTRGFGLHKLVTRCVFDAINGERHRLEGALDGRPMKGSAKLLATCREDLDDIAADGRAVIAVFDADKAGKLVQLSGKLKREEIVTKITTNCSSGVRFFVILLVENMESVVQAVAPCDPSIDRKLIDSALGKDLAARDIVLSNAAREEARTVRECALKANPSLQELVTRVTALTRGGVGPAVT